MEIIDRSRYLTSIAKATKKLKNFNFNFANSLFKILEYSDVPLKPSTEIQNDCMEV